MHRYYVSQYIQAYKPKSAGSAKSFLTGQGKGEGGEVSRFSVYMHGGPPYGRCIIDDPYCCIGLDLKEFILRAGPLQRVIRSVERAGKPNLLLDPKNGAVGLQS
ncbi:hypothetical protein Peur_072852 [Populus x canadensis]